MALRFRSDLVDLIELDRKHSQSYVEDSANEDRTNMAWKWDARPASAVRTGKNVKLFFSEP